MRWLGIFALLTTTACGSVTDPTADPQADAAPPVTSCASSTECPDESPVCASDGTCQACSADNSCDGALGRGLECRSDGQCVDCVDDSTCTGTQSVCDVDAGQCRGCESNDECASDVCDLQSSTCIQARDVVYFTASGPGSTTCTQAEPCTDFGIAQGLLSGTRRFFRFLPGTYRESFQYESSTNGPLVIVAGGAIFDWSTELDAEGLEIEAMPRTIVYEGTYSGIQENQAIRCLANPLTLIGVTVEDNVAGLRNLTGNSCEIEIYDSFFSNNSVAINILGEPTTVERSTFTGNRSTVLSTSGPFTIRNNLFYRNVTVGTPTVRFFNGTTGMPSSVFAHNTLTNNTPTAVQGEPGVMECFSFVGSFAIVGNIISNNDGKDSFQGCGESDPDTSRFIASNIAEGPFPPGNNNTSAPPSFADPSSDDYTLTGGVGVDDGDPLFSPPNDFDGTPRPLGAGPDRGAIESQ